MRSVLILMWLLISSSVWGQDARFALPGTDGVSCSVSWGAELIIAGSFVEIDGQVCHGIAMWDGTRWKDLMPEADGKVAVTTLAMDSTGRLFAVGNLAQFGFVACWDHRIWTRVDMAQHSTWFDAQIAATHDSTLYIVGNSTLSTFDGHSWSSHYHYLTSTIGAIATPITLYKLCFIGDTVLVAGDFHYLRGMLSQGLAKLYRDTGFAFSAPSVPVFDACRHGGMTYIAANSIYSYSDTGWVDIGRARDTSTLGARSVNSLVFLDTLYASGGWLGAARAHPLVAKLTIGGWQPVPCSFIQSGRLSKYDGKLLLLGKSDTNATRGVQVYDSGTWRGLHGFPTLGIDGVVYAMTAFRGDLYVAGNFASAGEHYAQNIARWTGSDWEPITTPLASAHTSSYSKNNEVYALAADDQFLYVGGTFDQIDTLKCLDVARWDGRRWFTMDSGTVTEWYRLNPGVHAFASDSNGRLIAAGTFDKAGSVAATSIASWDGQRWSSLYQPWPGWSYNVSSLASNRTSTFAGGKCYPDWSNPPIWSGLILVGGVLDTLPVLGWTINSLATVGDKLIAAAWFLRDQVKYGIAELERGSWTMLRNGLPQGRQIRSLLAEGDTLVAGSSPLSYWNGVQWMTFGDTLDGDVIAMHRVGNELCIGGAFQHAGSLPAHGFDIIPMPKPVMGIDHPTTLGKEGERITVSPNPFHDSAELVFSTSASKANGLFSIVDLLGREVARVPAKHNGNTFVAKLDGRLLPTGRYWVFAHSGDGFHCLSRVTRD